MAERAACASPIVLCAPIKLVVLDLNGVLVYSTLKSHEYPDIPCHTKARYKRLWYRPHLREFLAFLFEHFRVAVWTSNMRNNATAIVDLVFSPEQIKRLEFVWCRDQCELGDNYQSYKNLGCIIDLWPGLYNKDNVIIIDDSADKIVQPYKMYIIDEFTPDRLATDTALLQLKAHLATACMPH